MTNTTTSTMTFSEFVEQYDPQNMCLRTVTDNEVILEQNLESDGEDYCDLSEIISEQWIELWDFDGVVEDGEWEWNGNGS